MKQVTLACVGKLKEKYFSDAVDEYAKRLSRFCKFTAVEVADVPYPDGVKRESDALEKTFRPGEYRILADIGGELVDSEGLAKIVDGAFAAGKSGVKFIIGGSNGVDERIKGAVDRRISFGRMTYPHQLMRVVLVEQIYRAFTIIEGLPYHK